MTFNTISDICNTMFALEEKHGLLDYDVDDVKLWQYLRMPIYYKIAEHHQVIDSPHPDLKKSNLPKLIYKQLINIKSLIFYNPFFIKAPIDILLIDHERSKIFENKHIDIYSHFFIQERINFGDSLYTLEKPYQGSHLKESNTFRKHLDIVDIHSKLYKVFDKNPCSSKGEEKLRYLNEIIKKEFDIDSLSLLFDGFIRFKANVKIYKKLLSRLKPKKIYLVASYSYHGGLIKAAKTLGIQVLELQHGVFSNYHLGYHFPGRKKELDYFPDKFLCWGNYWKETTELPIEKKNIIDYRFEYFHHMKDKYHSIVRNDKQIVIISQGAISSELSRMVLALLDQLSDYDICYKLHPSEYKSWRKNPALQELSKMKNVDIIDDNRDLYKLFAESEYQFGVFSTALFEGIGLGCKTILFDLPGIEYMKALLEQKIAVLHTETDKIGTSLNAAKSIISNQATSELFGNFEADIK